MLDLLPPSQRTLPGILARQTRQFGARPLLSVGSQTWTHGDAALLAAGRAAALLEAGLVGGDRVALMSGNRAEFLELFLGCGWNGQATVPINTAAMGPQIEYYLTDSEAKMLVIEAAYLARLNDADLTRTALQGIWVLDSPEPDAEPRLDLPAHLQGVAVQAWPERRAPVDAAAVGPGETLAVLYTSGTTGPAKGVLCPHAQYYWWGINSIHVLGVTADDVLCSTLPLFHINALNTFVQAMLSGCRVVFEGRFSASGFWPAMRSHEATVVYLLGAMVPILLAQPSGSGERDHRVRIGLGPGVPAAAGEDFLARTGVRLLEGYGSTETNFVIATAEDSPRRGVMGWVLPGFSARVADENDVELPDGEAGELLLRADEPFAFASGYFRMPEKTVEAWRNLWFHTGDRVVREADGALRFVDRIKDAIRRRGENISSFEVEAVLLAHPDISEVAVFPVRSDLAEDEVMAALIPRPGVVLDLGVLLAWCATRMPRFAVPRYIDIVDRLPRTENGKVQKYELRQRGVGPNTWDGGAPPPFHGPSADRG